MNSLSWLLYLASVSSNLGIIAGVVGFFAFVTCIIGTVVFVGSDDSDYDKPQRETSSRMVRWSIGVFTICSLLLIVVPGRNTIYAIAASEMGEEMLNSETGSKAVRALDAWLDRQIEPPEEPAN